MGLVQSGFLDWDQAATGGQFASDVGQWWIFIGESQNQHIGRDGTILGAFIKLLDASDADSIAFAVCRLVSGQTYTLIALSEEIDTGTLSDGNNTITFTTPLKNVRSGDVFALCVKAATTGKWATTIDGGDSFIIDDSGMATMRWFDTNQAAIGDAFTVGANITTGSGGVFFQMLPMAPRMAPPYALIVGDSLASGSPHNHSYRGPSDTSKDRAGSHLARMCTRLGWSYENGANSSSSNNASQTLVGDLNAEAWAKTPAIVLCHVGLNDIADFWSAHANWYGTDPATPDAPTAGEITTAAGEYVAKMGEILTEVQANGAQLIVTDIYPWTNGDATQKNAVDEWNLALATWAASVGVMRLSIFDSLDDGSQALIPALDEDGAHLSLAGAELAGNALAGMVA